MHYDVNDLVVFRYEDTTQIGLVTNRRTKKGTSTYDLRSERGSSFLMVPVDNKKSSFYIDSAATNIFYKCKGNNNMYVDRNLGHTIANYSPDIILDEQHFERNGDFVFKTIGARSY